jgi:hypothetical protein
VIISTGGPGGGLTGTTTFLVFTTFLPLIITVYFCVMVVVVGAGVVELSLTLLSVVLAVFVAFDGVALSAVFVVGVVVLVLVVVVLVESGAVVLVPEVSPVELLVASVVGATGAKDFNLALVYTPKPATGMLETLRSFGTITVPGFDPGPEIFAGGVLLLLFVLFGKFA